MQIFEAGSMSVGNFSPTSTLDDRQSFLAPVNPDRDLEKSASNLINTRAGTANPFCDC